MGLAEQLTALEAQVIENPGGGSLDDRCELNRIRTCLATPNGANIYAMLRRNDELLSSGALAGFMRFQRTYGPFPGHGRA